MLLFLELPGFASHALEQRRWDLEMNRAIKAA
jgi:hypothetical protein